MKSADVPIAAACQELTAADFGKVLHPQDVSVTDEDDSGSGIRSLTCLYRSRSYGAAFDNFARLEVSQYGTSSSTARTDVDHWVYAYHGTNQRQVPNVAQYAVMFNSHGSGLAWTQVVAEKKGKKQLVMVTLSIVTLPQRPIDDAATELIRTTMIRS